MDNIKNDNYYIQKIQQDLEFIVKHMKNVDIYVVSYDTNI